MTSKMKKVLSHFAVTLAFISCNAFAQFPQDFSDVTWIDPDISGWPVTANLNVTVTNQFVILDSDKKNVWPATGNPILGSTNTCCNANAWVFAKFGERWYAVTWEWLKRGQSAKNRSAFEGGHTRRPPFFGGGNPTWTPQNGEIYGLMVSGFARFGIPANIRERSNIVFYKWGQGVVDASELLPEPEPEPQAPLVPVVDLLMDE